MSTERWEIGPVLSRAWQLFTANLGVILGAMFLMAIINLTFTGVERNLDALIGGSSGLAAALTKPLRLGVSLAGWAVSVFLSLGLIRLMLNLIRGGTRV